MGGKSRRKGAVGEREMAAFLRGHGVDARRGQQFKGGGDSPDVVTNLRGVHIECKRAEALRLYPALEQATADAPEGHVPVVAHRKGQQGVGKPAPPWVAILPLERFVQLLFEAGRVGDGRRRFGARDPGHDHSGDA